MNARWESAIRRNDVQAILTLLGCGTDVNVRDRHGQTALMLAAHAGHYQTVEILVACGANLDITAKYGLSALMLAIIAEHAEIASVLVKAGADLSLQGTGAPGLMGKTAYDLAFERGLLALCSELRSE